MNSGRDSQLVMNSGRESLPATLLGCEVDSTFPIDWMPGSLMAIRRHHTAMLTSKDVCRASLIFEIQDLYRISSLSKLFAPFVPFFGASTTLGLQKRLSHINPHHRYCQLHFWLQLCLQVAQISARTYPKLSQLEICAVSTVFDSLLRFLILYLLHLSYRFA